jgi:hypothetical protein
MFKHAVQNLAIALLFAASVTPVIHGFKTHSVQAGKGHVIVAGVSGTDPEPTEPRAVHAILAFLGLA